jgi:hypothetical protein
MEVDIITLTKESSMFDLRLLVILISMLGPKVEILEE